MITDLQLAELDAKAQEALATARREIAQLRIELGVDVGAATAKELKSFRTKVALHEAVALAPVEIFFDSKVLRPDDVASLDIRLRGNYPRHALAAPSVSFYSWPLTRHAVAVSGNAEHYDGTWGSADEVRQHSPWLYDELFSNAVSAVRPACPTERATHLATIVNWPALNSGDHLASMARTTMTRLLFEHPVLLHPRILVAAPCGDQAGIFPLIHILASSRFGSLPLYEDALRIFDGDEAKAQAAMVDFAEHPVVRRALPASSLTAAVRQSDSVNFTAAVNRRPAMPGLRSHKRGHFFLASLMDLSAAMNNKWGNGFVPGANTTGGTQSLWDLYLEPYYSGKINAEVHRLDRQLMSGVFSAYRAFTHNSGTLTPIESDGPVINKSLVEHIKGFPRSQNNTGSNVALNDICVNIASSNTQTGATEVVPGNLVSGLPIGFVYGELFSRTWQSSGAPVTAQTAASIRRALDGVGIASNPFAGVRAVWDSVSDAICRRVDDEFIDRERFLEYLRSLTFGLTPSETLDCLGDRIESLLERATASSAMGSGPQGIGLALEAFRNELIMRRATSAIDKTPPSRRPVRQL